MKNKLIIGLTGMALVTACSDDSATPLSTEENQLQVALYAKPDVLVETFNHHTQQVEEIPLAYNRQVFVDLDASTDTENADTTGVHYNDNDYKAFDLWETGGDAVTGPAGWDIVFAYYNGKTMNPETQEEVPYMMTGALLNKGQVKALKITEETAGYVAYDVLNHEAASALTLGNDLHTVGSDWKYVDFQDNYRFKIVANQYYLIETTDGVLFKLAFTGFYSDSDGTKGFPKFKFERLIAE